MFLVVACRHENKRFSWSGVGVVLMVVAATVALLLETQGAFTAFWLFGFIGFVFFAVPILFSDRLSLLPHVEELYFLSFAIATIMWITGGVAGMLAHLHMLLAWVPYMMVLTGGLFLLFWVVITLGVVLDNEEDGGWIEN